MFTLNSFLFRSGLIAGLCFGALAGLTEVAYLGLRRVWLARLVYAPEWYWWAAPWVNALLVAGATLVAVSLLPKALSRIRDTVRFGVPVGLSAAAVFLWVPGLHVAALLMLAIGVGASVGRFLAHWAQRTDRLTAWSLPAVLVVAPLCAALAFGLRRTEASSAERGGDLPNVLIIVLDTVRALELSLYGGRDDASPAIDRLAAEGAVFERASSAAPWTLPSHASLFTGRWASELSTSLLTPLDETYPTLAETLRALGYRTGGFSANIEYASAETGIARGFEHFEDHRWSVRGTMHLTGLSKLIANGVERGALPPLDQPGRVDAALINERFLRWLGRDGDAPFFAFLNYYDAHAPYYPPEPYWTRFVGDAPREPVGNPDSDLARPDRVELMLRAYVGGISYIDAHIDRLMSELAASEQLDNTLVIITSDHGEEFAEHGLLGHGNTLFLPSLHVPLIIRFPAGVPADCRIGLPVSTRDVPATVMDLIQEPNPFPGRALAELWRSPQVSGAESVVHTHTERAINQPAHFPASRGPLFGVERWPYRLLVESDPPSFSLFDRQADPLEQRDLAGEPAYLGVLDELSALLPEGAPEAVRPGPPGGGALTPGSTPVPTICTGA